MYRNERKEKKVSKSASVKRRRWPRRGGCAAYVSIHFLVVESNEWPWLILCRAFSLFLDQNFGGGFCDMASVLAKSRQMVGTKMAPSGRRAIFLLFEGSFIQSGGCTRRDESIGWLQFKRECIIPQRLSTSAERRGIHPWSISQACDEARHIPFMEVTPELAPVDCLPAVNVPCWLNFDFNLMRRRVLRRRGCEHMVGIERRSTSPRTH